MFDFDAGKLVVFGIVALAVIPPKDLPRVLRTVGKYVGQMRRMASDFQGQFMDAMREAELESVKKEIASFNDAAKVDVSFDPARLMRDNVTEAIEAAPKRYETAGVQAPADPPPAEAAAHQPEADPAAVAAAESGPAPLPVRDVPVREEHPAAPAA